MTAHGTALEAAYRGDGLRAWKEGATRTYFLYDGMNVVCELDAVGDLLAASTFGAAGLLSRCEVQCQFDPLGDAVHLLDAAGDVTANRLFDAWGNELTSGDFDPRGYRAKYGYYTDEETGLVALAYRYYGPGVGRFLNRDPIGYRGGVNVYGYAGHSAVSRTDISGTIPCPSDQYHRDVVGEVALLALEYLRGPGKSCGAPEGPWLLVGLVAGIVIEIGTSLCSLGINWVLSSLAGAIINALIESINENCKEAMRQCITARLNFDQLRTALDCGFIQLVGGPQGRPGRPEWPSTGLADPTPWP